MKKFKEFSINFIAMAICLTIIDYIFYKLHFIKEFSFESILGFMIGWSIIEVIKICRKK